MSERERQVMKKLKEVVDKQRDEIRAKDRELTLKNEDVEAVRAAGWVLAWGRSCPSLYIDLRSANPSPILPLAIRRENTKLTLSQWSGVRDSL
jgi:hypothetical protein